MRGIRHDPGTSCREPDTMEYISGVRLLGMAQTTKKVGSERQIRTVLRLRNSLTRRHSQRTHESKRRICHPFTLPFSVSPETQEYDFKSRQSRWRRPTPRHARASAVPPAADTRQIRDNSFSNRWYVFTHRLSNLLIFHRGLSLFWRKSRLTVCRLLKYNLLL